MSDAKYTVVVEQIKMKMFDVTNRYSELPQFNMSFEIVQKLLLLLLLFLLLLFPLLLLLYCCCYCCCYVVSLAIPYQYVSYSQQLN